MCPDFPLFTCQFTIRGDFTGLSVSAPVVLVKHTRVRYAFHMLTCPLYAHISGQKLCAYALLKADMSHICTPPWTKGILICDVDHTRPDLSS